MENANLLIAFIAVTAAAVVVQAGILIGMYLATRRTSARVEALASEVKEKVLPTVDLVKSTLTDIRPKIETLVTNVSESSATVRSQMQRLDATMNDVIDRARLQVIRADELVGRTLDRVEETTDIVHKTVVSPVRHVSGMIQGITAGVDFFFSGKRRRRDGVPAAQDEMFI
jgi:methyl-accepting chemotaxis protein